MAFPPALALLVATVGRGPLSPPIGGSALLTAVSLTTIATDADREDRAAPRTHARPQAEKRLRGVA